MAYEKKAIRFIKNRFPQANLRYHEWIRYSDAIGSAWCEPEAFIVLKEFVLLFEVKLTGGIYGRAQMEGLYKPLLEHIFNRPVRCLMVCKWTNPDTPGPFYETIESFLRTDEPFGTWHWLPQS